MANIMYYSARAGFATKQFDWVADTVSGLLVDTTVYTLSQSHSALNDIPAGARIASFTLASKTITATGGCMAANTSLVGVTGAYVGAVILYFVGGTEASSKLLVFLDTLPGLPYTPSGGNVLLAWNTDGNGIFRL